MDLKTGILAMLVGILVMGVIVSSVSAYTYVESYAQKSGWSCNISINSSNNQYIGATCDSGSEGSGYAKARSGDGNWTNASNGGMCCPSPKRFKAKSNAGGMTYRYAWVGCE